MILIVDRKGSKLYKKGNRIVISHYGEKIREISMDKVDGLIIDKGVSITSDLIESLCSSGIIVVIGKGCFISSYLKLGRADLRRRQMVVDKEKAALSFVRGKIENQIRHLRRWGYEVDFKEHENPFIEEAIFSKKYWEKIGDMLEGFRRDYKGIDFYNKMLNYGYGILKHYVLSSVLLKGLDPYFGFLHKERDYRISLVFDVMEPFRPVVDNVMLYYSLNELEGQFEVEFDFIKKDYAKLLVDRLSKAKICSYKHKKEITVVKALNMLVDEVVEYVKGKLDYIPMPAVNKWL